MSDFKGRRFPTGIILVCVRWYCKYGISYRDLEEMMSEHTLGSALCAADGKRIRWFHQWQPPKVERLSMG